MHICIVFQVFSFMLKGYNIVFLRRNRAHFMNSTHLGRLEFSLIGLQHLISPQQRNDNNVKKGSQARGILRLFLVNSVRLF